VWSLAERRRPGRALEAAGFRLLLALVRPLPRGAAAAVAAALGRFAFDVVRIRRAVAVANVLARLDPPGGRPEAERIARESYEVMARTFIDLLRFDRVGDQALWRLLTRGECGTVVAALDGEAGILVSGHFGNWELLLLGLRRSGLVLHAIARDQRNTAVDRTIRAARANAGVRTLSSRTGLRDAVRALRGGDSLATLIDQDAGGGGMFVDFLGAPAACHTGIFALAVRTGTPMIATVVIDERGRYRVATAPPWRADPARSEEENVRAGVEHVHRFLEAQVREHPENYFWAHRRWKTRPPAEAAAEKRA
jgi:KDO2-lipid IV(A) lauroyltransferase